MTHKNIRRLGATLLAAAAFSSYAGPALAQGPGEGPRGPILVLADPGNPFGDYYAEILRAEGLNEFAVANVGQLSASLLNSYQVVIVAEGSLDSSDAALLTNWVNAGGNLIAMRPGDELDGLLGLGADAGDVDEDYLTVAQTGPGAGITAQSMQFHGTADVRALGGGTQRIASLTGGAPAVTLRTVGSRGGQAAAFTYDLARSVVLTRQGNPGQVNRNFANPGDIDTLVRSNDLFQPDWLDVSKVRIPQADEQQRLLANLITQMNLDRAPLPRFWYLPRGEKAAVVMTGDDHANGGTESQFVHFRDDLSPAGCSVADWECVRATSYLYTRAPLGVTPAASLQAAGFEIALHLDTSCSNSGSLDAIWNQQLPPFLAKYTAITSPRTNRTHCIPWDDWIDEPLAELAHGVRLDTNYYYYPPTWALSRPGLFTGSGFPMRFADSDGEPIDVYQAATQITDEWGDAGQGYPSAATHINALLTAALGAEGYYGVFTANMHTDTATHAGADKIIAAAQQRSVPVVSAAQMLDWLDGRDGSAFRTIAYSGGRLTFAIAPNAKARGLQAMVPARSASGALTDLTRNGAAVSIGERRVVKGVEYVMFAGLAGSYVATFGSAAPGGGSPNNPPPGGGTGVQPGGALSSPTLPKAKLAPGRVQVSDSGRVRLRITCPLEERCSVQVKLRASGKTLASRLVKVRGGATQIVRLTLRRSARRKLARKETWRVTATAVLRDSTGGRSVARRKVRLVAP